MADMDNSDARIQLKLRFQDFLERDFDTPDDPSWNYGKALRELYVQDDDGKGAKLVSRRVMVHEHHLRDFDEALLQRLLKHPTEVLPAFEDALKTFVSSGIDPTLQKLLESTDLHIGIKGDFGRHEKSPRDLTSDSLGQLVALFGIVTKVSLVRPKVVKSVHYCEATKAFTTREYRDVTALTGLPTGSAQYPQRDDAGNQLTTEFGMCRYVDNQTISIQELPETAPPGQLPHSAEVILEDDLVDKVKPGDRVSIIGVYKAVAGKASGQVSGVSRAVVVGVSAHKLTRESIVKHTANEARRIRQLAERKDVLQLLGRSLAPSIFGHDAIKRGLVLLLFGGLEKNLANGTHLRGDINCLLVGDPGVAKSQLLRAAMNAAPHAVSTTGRGSSGVGLTAAVTTDNETGEKRLEAGAMVLADRGIVCIDEFDKMSEQDRVAIHEVMEQQTVTIAKAGIHCSLNARCSVLAAANPLYGTIDKSISIVRNVNLPDSLLSRFDLLFIVLDNMDEAKDRQVALHVIRQHQYRAAGDDGKGGPMVETIHDRRLSTEGDDGAQEPQVFMKPDARLHGAAMQNGGRGAAEVLTSEFLRRYIIFARRRYAREGVKITIDDDAAEAIIDFYKELRTVQDKALPVTARTLETIIRLATASCKVRLSFNITAHDVEVAKDLLSHCLLKKAGESDDEEERDGGEEADGADEDADEIARQAERARRRRDGEGGESSDGEDRSRRGRKRSRNPSRRADRGAAGPSRMDVDPTGRAANDEDGDEDGDGGAESSGGAAAQRASREERAAKRQATQGIMAVAGLAPSSQRKQQAAAAEQLPMSAAVEAQFKGVVQQCMEELRDLIPISELMDRLQAQNILLSEAAAAERLAHYSKLSENWRASLGVPRIYWDEDDRAFLSCSL